jgi:hypothetical protein
MGHIANMNRFAEVVKAEYYMMLCSDDMLGSATALQQAVNVLDARPDVVSVYSDMIYIDGTDRKLAKRRFKRLGLFEAQLIGQRSIRSLRNLFGIPLLHRLAACSDIRYPSALSYVGDVYFSLRVAERGNVYHIPEPLVWNRFSGQNLSRELSALSRRQFIALAKELDIRLTEVDRLWQFLAATSIDWRRRLFLTWARWRS